MDSPETTAAWSITGAAVKPCRELQGPAGGADVVATSAVLTPALLLLLLPLSCRWRRWWPAAAVAAMTISSFAMDMIALACANQIEQQ
jgi:hypothetical protein